MIIFPQGEIRLLRNVPLDPTYEHTIYWNNVNDQVNYFKSKTKEIFQRQSYSRVGNSIQIEKLADYIYDCNYLMFKNLDGTEVDKWYFAFITKITYINNKVSKIDYIIDDIQTWFFNYTLHENFVEREHTSSDAMYQNIVEENLDCGEELICVNEQTLSLNETKLIVLVSPNALGDGSQTELSKIDNVVSGVDVWEYSTDSSGLSDAETDLGSVVDSQGVLALYQCPVLESAQVNVDSEEYLTFRDNQYQSPYTPKNNKLYNYPYNFVQISNNNGSVGEFKFETSGTQGNNLVFLYRLAKYPYPQAVLYPEYYRGLTYDYDSGVFLSQFPTVAWFTDTFKAWWAQNKSSFVASFGQAYEGGLRTQAQGITNAIMGYETGDTGGFMSGLQQAGSGYADNVHKVLKTIAKVQDLKKIPPQMSGQLKTDSLNAKIGRIGYNIRHFHIKQEYAKIIDNYFTKYGYACKKLKVPNRKSRAHWCYVKTIGCEIEGSVPADVARNICNIYDNGITFWQNANEVGNYSLNNTPNGVEGA